MQAIPIRIYPYTLFIFLFLLHSVLPAETEQRRVLVI